MIAVCIVGATHAVAQGHWQADAPTMHTEFNA